jgi:hypothetical protein
MKKTKQSPIPPMTKANHQRKPSLNSSKSKENKPNMINKSTIEQNLNKFSNSFKSDESFSSIIISPKMMNLQTFENMRSYLLQLHFLNASLKKDIAIQKEYIQV